MDYLKKVLLDVFDLNADRASMEEISERIESGALLKGTNMAILILAMFIASIGLNMNSTAVIIGAMLISPLMGVIMAIGYGIAILHFNINYLFLYITNFYGFFRVIGTYRTYDMGRFDSIIWWTCRDNRYNS